jgi:hypothetical protein
MGLDGFEEKEVTKTFDGFYNHISAIEIRKQISSDVWNNYFKFCIERNPWDKTLSYFYMLQKRLDKKFDLEDYFEINDFCTDYDMYVDEEINSLLVDKIIKYENLNSELNVIFKHLGIPFDGVLDVNAKSEYRNDRRPYNEVLNKEQMDIIENKFCKEIKLLQYTR